MRKFLLFIFFIPFLVNAQKIEAFKESAFTTEYIYQKAPSYTKSDKYNRLTYLFSIIAGKQISDELNSDVLLNWQEMEIYLNEVLQKALPKALKNDSAIHVYLRKEGTFGANITPAGQLYINLGTFAELSDEATLAAMMLHELAHYHEQHYLKRFLISQTVGIDWGFFGSDKKPSSHFSQSQELAADSLASVWLKQTPYFHSGLLNYYRILERLEQKKVNRMENKWELKNPHFPPSNERITYYEKAQEYAKPNLDNKQLFAVSETQFNTLKNQAKPLILETLLTNPVDGGFDECIERAFAFHLLEPNNSTYIFYLMEAIRRKCYVFNHRWEQKFITHRYLDTTTIENVRKKIDVKNHLFEKFDARFIALNPTEFSKIKVMDYWKNPPFVSYSDAFVYFFEKATALNNCNECILTYALGFHYDEAMRDVYLKEYLQKEPIKFGEYATSLLEQDFETTVADKKLVVIDKANFFIREGNEPVLVQQNKLNQLAFKEIINELNQYYADRYFVLLEDVKQQDFKMYSLIKQLKNQLKLRDTYMNKAYQIHYLEPNFATLFTKYNVNEIAFMNLNYFEFRKGEKTMLSMKNTHQTAYDVLFENTTNQKSLNFEWLGFRLQSDYYPYFYYVNEDIPIKAKTQAKEGIISNLKNEIYRYESATN